MARPLAAAIHAALPPWQRAMHNHRAVSKGGTRCSRSCSRPLSLVAACGLVAAHGAAAVRRRCEGHRRERVGPGDQTLRSRLPPGRADRARRRGRLPGRACCRPGWHFGLWRWQYRVVQGAAGRRAAGRDRARRRRRRRAPSRPSASSAARSRATTSRTPRRSCATAASAGRQLGVPHRGHVPHQPGAVRGGHRAQRRAARHARRPICACIRSRPTRSASSPSLDGRPIPAGDLAGPPVAGHDSFQRGQAFIDAGRLPRPAGGGAALRLVEPEPVVRRRSS